MSHATAKTHVSRLLTKLDARDRAQLVMIAYESGVVIPGFGLSRSATSADPGGPDLAWRRQRSEGRRSQPHEHDAVQP